MTAVRAIYLYKPRTQGMAAEMRTWHVGVAALIYEKGVGHGRMDYRGAYGRVMWPWFATGLEGQRNESHGSAVTLCVMGH